VGRGLPAALLVLLLAASPAPLRGIESNDVAALAGGTVGKGLRAGGWNRNAPVDIQSEEMTVDFEEHRIIFKGDVKVLQADFSLTAGQVTAVIGESADDIEKIVAVGDVMIQKADKTAWGEEATYSRENATIRLTGSPVLKQGRNFIKGEEILVRLDEDRMEVKGRVQAEFILSEKDRDQGSGVRGQDPSTPPEGEPGSAPGE
jgi:lipopolysaccharide export system protein LptA